jgi:hypothetical protein
VIHCGTYALTVYLCKAVTLLLEPHLQSIFGWSYFGDGGLINYLPRLALNLDPPDLSLPRSWDYRRNPLGPDLQCILIRLIPSVIPPYPSSLPFLEQFQQVSCSIFIHVYKVHPPYSASFTLSIYAYTLAPTHRQDLFYLPGLHFFKYILAVQGGFCWYFRHVCTVL